MRSLDSDFDELRQRLHHRTSLRNTGGDPVFYLVFPPSEILTVKRKQRAWVAKLKIDGWDVSELSLAEVIDEFFFTHPLRELWLSGESDGDLAQVNETLRSALMDSNVIESRIRRSLEEREQVDRGLLLISDVEALHPYLRIGAIEQRLQGVVNVPVVVLYPGVRKGKYNLSFLGIYPDDGNYRSDHVGG